MWGSARNKPVPQRQKFSFKYIQSQNGNQREQEKRQSYPISLSYQSLEGSDLSLTQGQTLFHGPLLVTPHHPPSISSVHLQPHHFAFLCSNILDSFGIRCAMKDFFLVIRCCKSSSLSRINWVTLWLDPTAFSGLVSSPDGLLRHSSETIEWLLC